MQPEKLGRYRIVKQLGRGAMGRVYLAHDPEIDRDVAIKTVQTFAGLPEAEQAEARARFQREARSAGRLLHPGIVTIFDVGEEDGIAYLAMERVEGRTLDTFCRPGDLLPQPVVAELVARAAEALDFAHRQDIVHRDVKPANLMRVAERDVKVMDFGLARASEASLTHDGALLGTPSYMSPEQIRGESLDGRSDLFSLAVVLFELLTGEKPFPGDSVSSIIYRIVHEPPRELAESRPDLPVPLREFLARALAKDREDRFRSGAEFAEALREVAGLEGGAPAEDEPPSRTGDLLGVERVDESALPPPSRSGTRRRSSGDGAPRRPWILLALLLLLLLVAAGAAWVFRADLAGLRERIESLGAAPPPVVWQARVRTEPAGLPVFYDGSPLDGNAVEFGPEGPFGTLSATMECRTVERELAPADAGGEIVLVADPVAMDWTVDPGVPDATVRLNGEPMGDAPATVSLDLCRANTVEVRAAGFRPAELELPAASTTLEARTRLAGLELEPLPLGRIALPETRARLTFRIDGEKLEGREAELPEGEYALRYTNEALWIDITQTVQVQGGRTVRPELNLPGIATLKVQPFPPNCKVWLRRPGGPWKFLDEAPLETRVAAGEYEVRIRLNPTGQERVERVRLRPGANDPVRVNFRRDG